MRFSHCTAARVRAIIWPVERPLERIIGLVILFWAILFFFQTPSSGQDPNQVLAETRARVVQVTRNLPRFTCLETVDREYFDAPPIRENALTTPPTELCPAIFVEPDGRIPQFTDRLRLEVTADNGREIHAWPTATEFDTRPIEEIVQGAITTGGFGGYLSEVFDNPGTRFAYIGERVEKGRKMFEYSYRTPLETSRYIVGKTHRITGHGGWFLIDPGALEVVHLVVHTDQVPPETGMCRDHNAIDYHRVAVGDGQLILPAQAVMQILQPGGSVSKTKLSFSSCREYKAESTIRFDDADSGQGSTAAAKRSVPAGVRFTLRTIDPLDFNTAAAGDPVVARVVQTSNRHAVPEGATVSGRISVLRHYIALNRYQLAFALETLTANGTSTRFAAVPERPRNVRSLPEGFRSRGAELSIPPPGASTSEASFVLPGRTSLIKPGFESLWVTAH